MTRKEQDLKNALETLYHMLDDTLATLPNPEHNALNMAIYLVREELKREEAKQLAV